MAALNFTKIITTDFFSKDQHAGRKRKRHRPAVSCAPCRQRKVRCDRELPCDQCQKQDVASSCSYTSEGVQSKELSLDRQQLRERPSPNAVILDGRLSQSPPQDDVHHLKSRIHELEQLLSITIPADTQLSPKSACSKANAESLSKQQSPEDRDKSDTQSNHFKGILRGERDTNKTRYIGVTHWAAILHEFSEMRLLLDKDPSFHNSHRVLAELKRLHVNSIFIPPTHSFRSVFPDRNHLTSLLPDRKVCDSLVEEYFQSFGALYDFIHRPSFLRRYNSFWSQPSNSHPIFISLILLLVSISMLNDDARKSQSRYIARTVEMYLSGINALRKPCIALFQTMCLLILSKFVGCSQSDSPDTLWGMLGTTMKMAFATGLHRNPVHFSNVTPFRAELRTRLWATFVRLDLEYSLQFGIPQTLRASDYDCPFPSNLDLNDIDDDMAVSPKPHPDHIYTDSSFTVVVAKLVHVGLEIQNSVCAPGNHLSIEDADLYTSRLETVVGDTLAQTDPKRSPPGPMFHMQRAIISTFVHRLKLILLTHVIFKSEKLSVQQQRSILNRIFSSAVSIITIIEKIAQTTIHWRLIHSLLWADACRAAFAACFALRRLRNLPRPFFLSEEDSPASEDTFLTALTAVESVLEQGLTLGFSSAKRFVLVKAVATSTRRSLYNYNNDLAFADILPRTVEAAGKAADLALATLLRSGASSPPSSSDSTQAQGQACLNSNSSTTSSCTGTPPDAVTLDSNLSKTAEEQNAGYQEDLHIDAVADLPLLNFEADYGWFDDFIDGQTAEGTNAQFWGGVGMDPPMLL